MAPKKEKGPKERLRDLIDEYEINFEGPVLEKNWPEKYRHHFRIIRQIWATRYEEYTQRRDIDPRRMIKQRARVRDLRNKAYSLRKNIRINEDTWREVEKLVFKRFDEEIICHRCKNEKWKSDYEADPFDEKDKARLENKRKDRNTCQCHLGIESASAYDDSDDECESRIFDVAIGAEATHDPDDRFEKSGIPMHPDRVVGLSRTNKFRNLIASCPPELTHCPIYGMHILYPFLVMEAKREDNAPGFRAVEAQTAFPIRRFLKVQNALRRALSKSLDPLVWFFAYQGEGWRLYAGTLEDSKVRVYDLWHGTIESHDGALQLFQIVDFIWTWARDVHRRQIRNCLRGHDADGREVSPTSTNPFARSESVFSTSSLRSLSHALFETRENSVMPPEDGIHSYLNIRDASSHPFLKWASYCDASAPWTAQTSTRRADIIAFSFRVLLMPDTKEEFHSLLHSLRWDEGRRARLLNLLALTQQSSYSVLLRRRQIWDLAKNWTGVDLSPSHPSSATSPEEVTRAFFFFRTFCQRDNWQIKREVYCIMSALTVSDAELYPNEWFLSIQHAGVLRTLAQVRNIFGKESVAYALRSCSLILRHPYHSDGAADQLEWSGPSDEKIAADSITQYFALFNDMASVSEISRLYHRQSVGLLQVLRTGESIERPSCLTRIPENVGRGAVLAIRPSSWPSECPRFCLFVLLEHGIDDKARLGRLLHDAVEDREMYFADRDTAQGQPSWSTGDWKVLQDWEALLSSKT